MLSPYSTIAQAAIVELEAEIARLLEIQVSKCYMRESSVRPAAIEAYIMAPAKLSLV